MEHSYSFIDYAFIEKEVFKMGRKRKSSNEIKVNTKIRIRKDLKDLAIEKGVNFSQVMEESLKNILKEYLKKM